MFVSGKVQGVGYRAAAASEARRAGLRGWVRNLPDGRVEAAFEGAKPSVEVMIAWCRRGPPGARVRGVEAEWEPAQGETSFAIQP